MRDATGKSAPAKGLMQSRLGAVLLALVLGLTALDPAAFGAQSLVPAGERMSDFKARLLLARLYSYSPATLPQSLAEYERLLAKRPSDPALMAGAGEAYLRLGRYPEALALLERAAASGKTTAAVYAALADARYFTGDADGARAAYEKALALTPADPDLRLRLAGLLVRERRFTEALALLDALHRERPEDVKAGAMLVQTLAGAGKRTEAAALAKRLLAERPDDPELLLALAEVYAALGDAAASRDIFVRLMALDGKSKQTLETYADRLNIWGDFYAAEDAWRAALAEDPKDRQALLGLAGTLANAQRYEEARGVYARLLREDPSLDAALLGLAETRLREKNPAAALDVLEKLLAASPDNRRGLALRERALEEAGRLDEALADARTLAEEPLAGPEDQVRLGALLLRLDRTAEAEAALARALEDSRPHPGAAFFTARAAGEGGALLARVLADGEADAPALFAYGSLFARKGEFSGAAELYQAALDKDAGYFPAKMALAEVLASAGEYDRALSILDALESEFPEASKILLTRARVLSYAKRYDAALAAYERLSALRPEDPTPLKEMARTAMWGKMPERSAAAYARMGTRKISPETLASLDALASAAAFDPKLQEALAWLRDEAGQGRVYPACDQAASALAAARAGLSEDRAAAATAVEDVLAALSPDCEIGKAAAMEQKAKSLGYARRFAAARKANEKLVEFQPGNQEALFDKAQAECALGLPDEEAKTYARLLELDPLHALASQALSRVHVRARPELRAGYSFWDEDGKKGRLAQITRQRFDMELTWPLKEGRYYAALAQHLYIESPKAPSEAGGTTAANTGSTTDAATDAATAGPAPMGLPSRAGTYLAEGQTLRLGGRLNEYLRADASFTNKIYADPRLGGRIMGFARIEADFSGYARLGLGFERTEEIYNDVGLFDAIMANNLSADLYLPLARRLELAGRGILREYSDGNEQVHLKADLGLTILEHPTTLKLVLTGEHRQTRELSDFIYQDGVLTGITHPYWTPQDYFAGTAALEWRHDLSEFFFCGARQHYYGLRLSGGTDTDENPFARVEGEYHFDMNDHVAFDAKGLLHRSQNWDALGAWVNLMYRF